MKFPLFKSKVSKIYVILGLSFVAVVFSLILGISYYSLRQFTYASDMEFYGEKVSALAKEIREELLRRKDIKQVVFKNDDGQNLLGLMCIREKPKANMVVCHGYRTVKEFLYRYIDFFPDYNILFFDFRAHGQSEGSLTTIGVIEYKDVLSAVHFMKKSIDGVGKTKLPMILLGISMGGAASIKAASLESDLCDAVVIDSSYAHLGKIMRRVFPWKSGLPSFPFVQLTKVMYTYKTGYDPDAFSPVECIRKIKQPLMLIHSCNDSFIPPENCLELYSNSTSKMTKLWIAPKSRHGYLYSEHSQLYKNKIEHFLKKALFIQSS